MAISLNDKQKRELKKLYALRNRDDYYPAPFLYGWVDGYNNGAKSMRALVTRGLASMAYAGYSMHYHPMFRITIKGVEYFERLLREAHEEEARKLRESQIRKEGSRWHYAQITGEKRGSDPEAASQDAGEN